MKQYSSIYYNISKEKRERSYCTRHIACQIRLCLLDGRNADQKPEKKTFSKIQILSSQVGGFRQLLLSHTVVLIQKFSGGMAGRKLCRFPAFLLQCCSPVAKISFRQSELRSSVVHKIKTPKVLNDKKHKIMEINFNFRYESIRHEQQLLKVFNDNFLGQLNILGFRQSIFFLILRPAVCGMPDPYRITFET